MFSNMLLALLTFCLKIHYRSVLRRVNKIVCGITLAHPRSHMSWLQGRNCILQHNYGVEHLLHYVDDFYTGGSANSDICDYVLYDMLTLYVTVF